MELHTEEGSPVRRGTPACVHGPYCTPMTRVSVLCAFPTRGVDHVAEAELLECTSCTQGVLCRWGLVLPYWRYQDLQHPEYAHPQQTNKQTLRLAAN